jgi:hypothetical protein
MVGTAGFESALHAETSMILHVFAIAKHEIVQTQAVFCHGLSRIVRSSSSLSFWKQSRLRCFGKLSGLICLRLLACDALAVERGFAKQVERLRHKPEFTLLGRQAASVSFHGV